jgi:hypothetical protein
MRFAAADAYRAVYAIANRAVRDSDSLATLDLDDRVPECLDDEPLKLDVRCVFQEGQARGQGNGRFPFRERRQVPEIEYSRLAIEIPFTRLV